jgi:hypothetical protein
MGLLIQEGKGVDSAHKGCRFLLHANRQGCPPPNLKYAAEGEGERRILRLCLHLIFSDSSPLGLPAGSRQAAQPAAALAAPAVSSRQACVICRAWRCDCRWDGSPELDY